MYEIGQVICLGVQDSTGLRIPQDQEASAGFCPAIWFLTLYPPLPPAGPATLNLTFYVQTRTSGLSLHRRQTHIPRPTCLTRGINGRANTIGSRFALRAAQNPPDVENKLHIGGRPRPHKRGSRKGAPKDRSGGIGQYCPGTAVPLRCCPSTRIYCGKPTTQLSARRRLRASFLLGV
jgi:hypothetical protein